MKMSDALRAAAESAPVEDVRVSTGAAASRVRRHRALRAGANGIVGVGAAALVIAGVVSAINQGGLVTAASDTAGREDVSGEDGGQVTGGAMEPAPGIDVKSLCGGTFDPAAWAPSTVTGEVSLTNPTEGFVPATTTLTATSDGRFAVGMPIVLVLSKDTVVAEFTVGPGPDAWLATAGDTTSVETAAELYSCWGTEFPAGEYALATVTPITEPGDPDTSVSSDVAEAPTTYAVAEPVPFTVAGEPVDDPFGTYLSRPSPEPVLVSVPSAATPTDARAAYEKALTSDRWDMAAGTQRVVMTSAADDLDGTLWAKAYFGCPVDGVRATFPKQSAQLDWLDVTATIPATIHVSYGWVVDGNPKVSFSVTNATEWSLPGFYPGSGQSLYLVRDGRVVAEAYPVGLEPGGYGIAYASDGAKAIGDSIMWPPSGDDGYLKPGDTSTGTYLWRDVTGCWSESGQAKVPAGTYTVLTARDITLGGGDVVAYERGVDAPAGATPEANANDYVSFQVWTSLGSVTVTN